MKHQIQWTTPSPLWESAIAKNTAELRRAELARPAILRFATDSFMDDFLKTAANDPKRLGQFLALPETWRGVAPMPEALNPAPAFARNFQRLGLISSRKKAKRNGQIQTADKFKNFADKNAAKPLKLYQPAHQRFYMISACLVCERPGLPDKIPDSGREEKVSYVIRRLFPAGTLNVNTPIGTADSSWEEYAYVVTDQGAKWKKVSNKNSLEANEERQPLFSVDILEDDGRRRKIFAGVIPTGKRESYIAAGKAMAQNSTDSGVDPRVFVMRSIFRDPWKSLLQSAANAKAAFVESNTGDAKDISSRNNIMKGSREQIQTASWLILLDFAKFLSEELPRIWKYLNGESVSDPSLTNAETTLISAISNVVLEQNFADNLVINTPHSQIYSTSQVKRSLKDALVSVKPANAQTAAQIEKNLETVVVSYNRASPDAKYPAFLFPLADPSFSLKSVLDGASGFITPTDFVAQNFDGEAKVNRIAQLVEAVIKELPKAETNAPTPLISQTPLDMREGWFVIRCVYERPLCGAIDPPILSEPTKRFQIAGFFDADAPARPIRIALPVDTTPAGLRKFDRNTAFMMSDLLCGQVSRMKGITFGDLIRSVLPFPLHKDLSVPDSGGCKDSGLSIGMMCSLSIPIITICALLLLMIIVSLLDFIFRWMPFFIFCFPLPGLKAKNE